jgi:PadR family transcriptional regulator PadR
MRSGRTNPDFANGVPELLVLSMLARRPMHGYELVRTLQTAAGKALALGEGCIYPILHRLEAEQLLASRSEQVGKRTRIVYQVTAAGQRRVVQRVASWQQITEAVTRALEGGAGAEVRLA